MRAAICPWCKEAGTRIGTVSNFPCGSSIGRSHGIQTGVCVKLESLKKIVSNAKDRLDEIVVTSGEDRGVILMSSESPMHYDKDLKCHVYDVENFSDLGNALVKLFDEIDAFDSQ